MQENPVLLGPLDELRLSALEVDLDLIRGGLDPGLLEELLGAGNGEVRDTDVLDLPSQDRDQR